MIGALPVALLVRDRHMISAFSAASVAFVLLFAAVIALLAIAPAAAGAGGAAAGGRLLLWRAEGLLVAFPVMAYGFTAHPYYLGIYGMLPSPSTGSMMQVTDMVGGGAGAAGGGGGSPRHGQVADPPNGPTT